MKWEKEGITEIWSTMISLFDVEEDEVTEEQKSEEFFIWTLEKIDKTKAKFKFLSCPENHLCGFLVNFQYYFNKWSPIGFKFPKNKPLPWCEDVWKDDFKVAKQMEEKSKINIDWDSVVKPEDVCC